MDGISKSILHSTTLCLENDGKIIFKWMVKCKLTYFWDGIADGENIQDYGWGI